MAQLKDLLVYGDAKFLADVVLDHNPTANLQAATKQYVDAVNTTYTFTNGTNGFTVTPRGGSAQTVTVTPSIANNVTGSGTSGYLVKFNGANTITNGPALGSGTTTYLRNDGSWATPTNTTYTFANGTNGFTVTPAGGSAQTVTVTPSITNNVTGSGTSGYIAKFNGTNTITNGPAFGSGTTTYLRNDGSWATPTDTNNAVTQTATTTNAAYEVLFSVTADNTTRTEGARKNSNLTFNPSTGILSTVGYTLLVGTTAKAQMVYDSSVDTINFVFV